MSAFSRPRGLLKRGRAKGLAEGLAKELVEEASRLLTDADRAL